MGIGPGLSREEPTFSKYPGLPDLARFLLEDIRRLTCIVDHNEWHELDKVYDSKVIHRAYRGDYQAGAYTPASPWSD
jgi:hypothetical protein